MSRAGSPTSSFLVPFCASRGSSRRPRRTRGVKSLVALATGDLVVCYCDAFLSFSFFFFFLLGIDGKRSSRVVMLLRRREKSQTKAPVAVERRERLVRLGETWLSIIRIDME